MLREYITIPRQTQIIHTPVLLGGHDSMTSIQYSERWQIRDILATTATRTASDLFDSTGQRDTLSSKDGRILPEKLSRLWRKAGILS